MKTIVTTLLALVAFNLIAGPRIVRNAPSLPNGLNDTDFTQVAPAVLTDTYRIINGTTQKVDSSWVAVSGTVAQVHPGEGLRIRGSIEGRYQSSDFFVTNLPVTAAEDDTIPPRGYVLLVKEVGTYRYSTAAGSTRTLRLYDYGKPWVPPPLTPEQIAAQKADIEARKADGIKRQFEADKIAIEKDDAGALERMGERYRDGQLVETNLAKAKIYFMRAELNGSTTAADKIKKME